MVSCNPFSFCRNLEGKRTKTPFAPYVHRSSWICQQWAYCIVQQHNTHFNIILSNTARTSRVIVLHPFHFSARSIIRFNNLPVGVFVHALCLNEPQLETWPSCGVWRCRAVPEGQSSYTPLREPKMSTTKRTSLRVSQFEVLTRLITACDVV